MCNAHVHSVYYTHTRTEKERQKEEKHTITDHSVDRTNEPEKRTRQSCRDLIRVICLDGWSKEAKTRQRDR